MLLDSVHLPGGRYRAERNNGQRNSRLAIVTEEKVLQTPTFLKFVVFSPSLYMLVQFFSSISVNSGF